MSVGADRDFLASAQAMSKTDAPQGPSIVWFREDLRLADNPALHAGHERGAPLLCVFVMEEDNEVRPDGAAARWWLHHSLEALADALDKAGARLDILAGASATLIPELAKTSEAGALFFNRRYGAPAKLDEHIEEALGDGCPVEVHNGRLLNEPWEIKTKTGGSYGVFTPYWKTVVADGLPDKPLPKPRKLDAAPYPACGPKRVELKDLGLLPTTPDWAAGLREAWTPGEDGALARLREFLDNGLKTYGEERNKLASYGTSRLSPHLRFGEISPRTIVAEVKAKVTKASADGAKTYLSEIGWREFDYHNLHYHPDVATKNLHGNFDRMPWDKIGKAELDRWKKGRTGFPVVDAGMRELWTTGYMHNRVRMITASFLIKDLLCDWRVGEEWFWDCLCDADPANNTMNWQWVAGSGADAAPFFRIFNPVSQGEKFDPAGEYVRRWVPELGRIEGNAIHSPWELSGDALEAAGVDLGKTYPEPMVEHKKARQRALDAYEKVKK